MNKNTYNILSLDGGGIRGYISSLILKDLETSLYINESSYSPLLNKFDLITGSSTGSLIMALLAKGYKAESIPSIYEKWGPIIFSDTPFNITTNSDFNLSPNNKLLNLLNSLKSKLGLAPRFSTEKLQSIAQHLVPGAFEVSLEEFDKESLELLVPLYDVLNDKLTLVSSKHKELLMSEIVVASSCFPTVFGAQELEINKIKSLYMDGGIAVSNPSLLGVIHALNSGYELGDIRLVSIGTGTNVVTITEDLALAKGKLGWLTKLPSLLHSGGQEVQEYFAKNLTVEDYRFQVSLDRNDWGIKGTIDMTDTSKKSFSNMRALVKAYTQSEDYNSQKDTLKKIWNSELFNT